MFKAIRVTVCVRRKVAFKSEFELLLTRQEYAFDEAFLSD